LLGSSALHGEALELAGSIAADTGAQLLAETFPPRLSRGEGQVQVQLIPYFLEMAQASLAEYQQVILVGAQPPVSTFAYRGAATHKLPGGCETWAFASPDHDLLAALSELAGMVAKPGATVARTVHATTEPPAGALTPAAIGRSISLLMPENAIVVDEGATAGMAIYQETAGARRHDYLYSIPGGAIGGGLPLALGAAVACPGRKVVALQADGSAMYTNQALWSLARERCDVTVVLLKNDAYAVLDIELARVRQGDVTPKMHSLMDLARPSIDWTRLAEGMGVSAVAVADAAGFHEAFEQAMAQGGPRLIEASIEQDLQPVVDLILQHRQA
jgi:acetolactate synthase-1/2/3 large subunit